MDVSPKLSVTVIICAYTEKRWNDLAEAVQSVRDQSLRPIQCVIVIDHNHNLFCRAIGSFPDMDVVENSHSSGLAGARNTGIRFARGDVVAFLDDDASANKDWLEQLVLPYTKSSIKGTGSVIKADWIGGRPGWFPSEFLWVVGCSYRGLPVIEAPIRNPIGAAMSFRRSVFDEVGDFDGTMGRVSSVPLGCEETALGIRIQQRFGSGRIVHVPTAVVYHKVGPERSTISYLIRRCFAEGVSKAMLAELVGAQDASSSERNYVFKALPSGVVSGLMRTAHGDLLGPMASGVIVIGLGVTTVGYVLGRLGLSHLLQQWMTGRLVVTSG